MEKKRQICSAAVVLALVGGFAFLVLRRHEPLCEGRPLSEWLLDGFDKIRQAPNNWTKLPDEKPVRTLGPAAIPTLLDMVSTRETDWNAFVSQIAREKEMAFLHLPRLEGKREAAVWAFKALGPQAAPAVPALIKLLNNPDAEVQAAAARSLGNIGPASHPAVGALIKLWQRTEAVTNMTTSRRGPGNIFLVRSSAASALAEIGPAALPAIPWLSTATNDLDAELATLRIRQDSLITYIEGLTNTSNPGKWVRRASLLAVLGTNAEPAIPFLLATLSNTNISLQHQALYSLASLHTQPGKCIPALIPFLKSTNTALCALSARALGAFGNCATSAVPQLRECLTNREDWVKNAAESALAEIEPKSDKAKRK